MKESDRSVRVGNQPAPYRGLSGPSGPKCRKSLENVSEAPGPRKVSKKSREQSEKTLSTLFGDSPETSQTVPETFWRLFGVPGPEAPGDIFETFLAFRARRARETSVRGGLVPKVRVVFSRAHQAFEHSREVGPRSLA